MKKVFISHPFSGKIENYRAVTHICEKLWPLGILPISPVHAFSFLKDSRPGEREVALKFCNELMKDCDEVWFFGEWGHSEGCRREFVWAQLNLVPVRIVADWKEGRPIFKEQLIPENRKTEEEIRI